MSDSATPDRREEELTGSDELLWRNINPSWIDDGKLTSQAFRPTPKDEKRLSVARQRRVSAADHFDEFTTELGLTSVGVWAVSVGEATAENIRAVYDENAPTAPVPVRPDTPISTSGFSRRHRPGARELDYAITPSRAVVSIRSEVVQNQSAATISRGRATLQVS